MRGIRDDSLVIAINVKIHRFQNRLADQDLVAENKRLASRVSIENVHSYWSGFVDDFGTPIGIPHADSSAGR